MTDRQEVTELALRFQVRCLTLFRRLFMDLQEREYSVEIRNRAVQLQKAVKAGDYSEAKNQTDNIAYLFKILYQISYIKDDTYKSLAVDAAILSATLQEAIDGEIPPEG